MDGTARFASPWATVRATPFAHGAAWFADIAGDAAHRRAGRRTRADARRASLRGRRIAPIHGTLGAQTRADRNPLGGPGDVGGFSMNRTSVRLVTAAMLALAVVAAGPVFAQGKGCLLFPSPGPRGRNSTRIPASA